MLLNRPILLFNSAMILSTWIFQLNSFDTWRPKSFSDSPSLSEVRFTPPTSSNVSVLPCPLELYTTHDFLALFLRSLAVKKSITLLASFHVISTALSLSSAIHKLCVSSAYWLKEHWSVYKSRSAIKHMNRRGLILEPWECPSLFLELMSFVLLYVLLVFCCLSMTLTMWLHDHQNHRLSFCLSKFGVTLCQRHQRGNCRPSIHILI